MKTKLSLAGLLIAICVAVAAPTTTKPSVTLAWDQSADPSVNGYILYYGSASRVYTNQLIVIPRTATSVTVPNLERGVTYFFAATCTATNGLESAYSAEVSYRTAVLPAAPVNLRLTVDSP